MKRFEYGNAVTFFRKVARAGKSARSGADYRDFMSVWLRFNGFLRAGIVVTVCDESFQSAYAHGFEFNTERALGFALRFLRAYAAAYSGKRRILGYFFICAFVIAFFDFLNKRGNIDIDGATRNARFILAVQATLGFGNGYFFGITCRYFFEVMRPYFWIL